VQQFAGLRDKFEADLTVQNLEKGTVLEDFTFPLTKEIL
jgi:hypothetical protein